MKKLKIYFWIHHTWICFLVLLSFIFHFFVFLLSSKFVSILLLNQNLFSTKTQKLKIYFLQSISANIRRLKKLPTARKFCKQPNDLSGPNRPWSQLVYGNETNIKIEIII